MRCSAGRGGVKPARSSGKRLSNPQTMFRLRQSDPISTSALDSIVSESPSQQSGLLFPLSTTESKLPHCDILGHRDQIFMAISTASSCQTGQPPSGPACSRVGGWQLSCRRKTTPFVEEKLCASVCPVTGIPQARLAKT